jgi:hypothetical protein
LAILAPPCLTTGRAVHAGEPQSPAAVEVAAVAPGRDDTAVSRRAVGDGTAQLELLLAQNTAPDASEEREHTVLAGFPMSAPQSVEEGVAKAYKLEIVRRITVQSLARRIVVYRIKDGRAPADLVAALEKDARIVSVQVNVRYASPLPEPEAAPGSPQPPAGGGAPEQVKKRAAAEVPKPIRSATPARAATRARPGQAATAAKPAVPMARRAEGEGSLVATKQAALRWPTADEPFVNVGAANK